MKHQPTPAPRSPHSNPLLGGCTELNSLSDVEDVLSGCASCLFLLADLFGSEAGDFTTLNTSVARRGMFWQLSALAGLLVEVSDRLSALRGSDPTKD
jgi:hypothetical protein